MLQVANIIIYVSILSVLLPLFFLLRRKQNFKSAPIKVLGILLFVSAFSSWISYVMAKMGNSNLFVINIHFVVQFFLLSYIYFLLLDNKKIIYAALFIFTVFFVISALFIQSINEYQSWSRVVGGIFILIFSVRYFLQIIKLRINFIRHSLFWLNSAVFLYFAFNLFLFAMTNYIIKNVPADVAMISYSFHNCNNIAKNILFAVAIFYVGAKEDEEYDGRDMTKL